MITRGYTNSDNIMISMQIIWARFLHERSCAFRQIKITKNYSEE